MVQSHLVASDLEVGAEEERTTQATECLIWNHVLGLCAPLGTHGLNEGQAVNVCARHQAPLPKSLKDWVRLPAQRIALLIVILLAAYASAGCPCWHLSAARSLGAATAWWRLSGAWQCLCENRAPAAKRAVLARLEEERGVKRQRLMVVLKREIVEAAEDLALRAGGSREERPVELKRGSRQLKPFRPAC